MLSLLSELASGQVDSSGVFTVDMARAREKLAQFQLGLPSFYLLKLVQAGVCAGARSMTISTGAELHLTMFDPDHTAFRPEDVMAGLTAPSQLEWDSALSHLCLGLLASLACRPRLLQWSTWRGDHGEVVQINDQGMATRTLEQSQSRWNRRRVRFDLILAGCTGRNPTQEKQAVKARVGYCPVSIHLNGFRVSGNYWGSEQPFAADDWRPAEQYWRGQSGPPGLGLPHAAQRTARLLVEGDRATPGQVLEQLQQLWVHYTWVQGGTVPASAIALFRPSQKPGKIVWVRHGVSCEATDADLGYSPALAVVDASSLRTDASQFQLVRDAALDRLAAQLRQRTLDLCSNLRANLDRVPWTGSTTSTCFGLSTGSCLGCLVASLIPAFWFIPFIVLSGGGAYAGGTATVAQEKGIRRILTEALDEALARR